MDLRDLPTINEFTVRLKLARELRQNLYLGQEQMGAIGDAASVVGEERLRQATIECCTLTIVEIQAELEKLGVFINDKEPLHVGTADEWKRECGMYQRAWGRELGPYLGANHHRIDALVVGTKNMRVLADSVKRT